MAKNTEGMLVEQAFKKPAQQKASEKEELKCEDFSNVLYRWILQLGKGKPAIEKVQLPPQTKAENPTNVEPVKPAVATGKAMSAAKFWEAMKLPKTGQVK